MPNKFKGARVWYRDRPSQYFRREADYNEALMNQGGLKSNPLRQWPSRRYRAVGEDVQWARVASPDEWRDNYPDHFDTPEEAKQNAGKRNPQFETKPEPPQITETDSKPEPKRGPGRPRKQ